MLQNFIIKILLEDEQGFLNDIDAAPKRLSVKNFRYLDVKSDPFFLRSGSSRNNARELKQLWNKHADHAFMDALVTIHWARDSKFLENLLIRAAHKDEISTSMYLPEEKMLSSWGNFGLIVKGRITFAANEMDFIYSGYHGWEPVARARAKYKSSGAPRRPSKYVSPHDSSTYGSSHPYVFDRATFESGFHGDNEAIVDNWQPKSLVWDGTGSNAYMIEDKVSMVELSKDFDLPLLDSIGKQLFP